MYKHKLLLLFAAFLLMLVPAAMAQEDPDAALAAFLANLQARLGALEASAPLVPSITEQAPQQVVGPSFMMDLTAPRVESPSSQPTPTPAVAPPPPSPAAPVVQQPPVPPTRAVRAPRPATQRQPPPVMVAQGPNQQTAGGGWKPLGELDIWRQVDGQKARRLGYAISGRN